VTVALVLGAAGLIMIGVAVWHERMMQKHRQPGVTYAQVTWRRDGGWRRDDLFTPIGLTYQRRASAFGFPGLVLVVVAIVWWAVSRG
jgi:hypothetical protein